MGEQIVPTHVAIIMDGNGRWANKRGLPRILGHRQGVAALKRTIKAAAELGVKYLTVYTFSTENWKRPEKEVSFLMSLLSESLDKEIKNLHKNKIKFRALGDLSKLIPSLQKKIKDAEILTLNNQGLQVNVMLNYGSRNEIVSACNKLLQSGVKNITEQDIDSAMYTADIPDPDIIIRTSGEFRTSNFLLWQSVYSEYWITKTLWPDFNKNTLKKAIADFNKRDRRYGGL